jgi:phosphopantothenoylcysteine decarboxylase/phosphopantothenate--cysteine ligase
LIIGGPTAEKVDDIRVITNRSSGKTAVNLAKQSFFMGGDVTVWYGHASEKVPDYIKKIDFRTITDLEQLINKTNLKKFEIIVVCAAISDYIPKRHKGKIKSGKDKLIIELKPAQKILPLIRKKTSKTILIGFKVEDKKEKLDKESINLLEKYNLDFVVGNTVNGFSGDENQIRIFEKSGKSVSKKGKKEELATFILNKIT